MVSTSRTAGQTSVPKAPAFIVKRAAHRSRDAGQELAAGQSMARRDPGHARARGASLGLQLRRFDSLHRTQPNGRDHGAAHASVSHQQIAAESDPQQRLALGELGEKGREHLDVGRLEVPVGEASDPPHGMAGQGLTMAEHAGAGLRCGGGHGAICAAGDTGTAPLACGAAHARRPHHDAASARTGASALHIASGADPMSPAPRVRTTSAGRTRFGARVSISATLSTNTGSTLPRARIARHSARPSATVKRRLPGGIHLEDHEHVQGAQHRREIVDEVSGPRVSMGLKEHHQPAPRPAGPHRFERGLDLARVMGVVVDDGDRPARMLEVRDHLETPADPLKRLECTSDVGFGHVRAPAPPQSPPAH